MCNRFAQLVRHADGTETWLPPHYDEIDLEFSRRARDEWLAHRSQERSPTDQINLVSESKDGINRIHTLTWGFHPKWAEGPLMNSQSEKLFDSPVWSKFAFNRCAIPALEFYEWKEVKGNKFKHRIFFPKKPEFYFAGIYGSSKKAGVEDTENFYWVTILTQEANSLMREIHNSGKNKWRQPVVLDEGQIEKWLDKKLTSHTEINSLMRPYQSSEIEAVEIKSSGSQMELF
ncbi:SOS response-associated peptidase [Leptospira weilii]|uniref:Abasic site processing protein n=1 Tax=Leptospira weilii str. UI 13098 TaxID=1088542 RepID=M6Q7I2_9LEPT|nr:SOS response-associated peptidase family protein [Leptospira weilii]EMN91294.1 hypothetical protein LEP1GSC108_3304 [Leptospira weilii str. UI 13098]